MLAEIGVFSLLIAIGMSFLQFLYGFNLVGSRYNYKLSCYNNSSKLAKFFSFATWFCVSLAFVTLVLSFVYDDFSIAYVASNSNSKLNIWYKFCAVWGGHEGSILLWILILQFWNLSIIIFAKKLPDRITSYMQATIGLISSLLLIFLVFTSNPFLRITSDLPLDGIDLNPLLQDIGFVSHPPMLYLGYVGTTVSFAFAIAVLLAGEIKSEWLNIIRPFSLLSFAFLTVGIVLGSWWAYYELGWGGWWFWDPVENASLMPWLTMVGFLHVLVLARKQQSYYAWVVLLAIISFSLSLLGTFLVRSGIITSVHAFVTDPIRGNYILGFLTLIISSSLIIFSIKSPKSQKNLKFGFLSRELFLLSNSAIFLLAASIVLLGTLYPLIIEVIYSKKISVGAPYFNSIIVPLFLCALPMIVPSINVKWGNNPVKSLIKLPFICILSLILALFILWFFETNIKLMPAIGVCVGVFIVLGTLASKITFNNIFMLVAHSGIGITIIGISIVSNYSIERNVKIAVGDQVNIAGYDVKFKDISLEDGTNYISHKAIFEISKYNEHVATMQPEKRFFLAQDTHMTETALLPGLSHDLYIALGDHYGNDTWSLKIFYKPFVRWIWFGGILIAIAGSLILIPIRRHKSAI